MLYARKSSFSASSPDILLRRSEYRDLTGGAEQLLTGDTGRRRWLSGGGSRLGKWLQFQQ